MRLFDLFRRKKVHRFIEVAREYIDRNAIENDLNPDTVRGNETKLSNVMMFLMEKNKRDIALPAINASLMEDMKFWLHKTLPTTNSTYVSRHIELCKRILKYSALMGYVEFSPIEPIKTRRDPTKEVIHLEALEIMKIIRRTFASESYNIVCDLYLFQCFTGLSYGDLWSWEIVREGGHQFITSRRKKTDRTFCTPYTPQADVILRRYDGQLPKITNQQYNRVLKEVAFHLNISKHLTTHTARKTFATLKNNQGFSLETIADMMGNTPDVARKHYIKGTRSRLINEMDRLKEESMNGGNALGTIL